MSNNQKILRLTPYEQIIEAPDMYIGATRSETKEEYIVKNGKIVVDNLVFSNGCVKIFDEIIVNIRDQHVRDKTMNLVKFNFDSNGTFSAYNNGYNGILVEMNKDYKMYNPHLIFGCLRSSTNYRQTGKLVGGKNGFGAKLTNIFSKKFTITVVDKHKRKYYQEFSDNMKNHTKPIISTTTETPYLLITFTPDYTKLNTPFSNEFASLIEKRIYDVTSCMKGVKVFYNDKQLNIASFKDYISCYYDKTYLEANMYFDSSERWEVAIVCCHQTQFSCESFVNGIYTVEGGTHVNSVMDKICKKIVPIFKEQQKFKDVTITPASIKKILRLFLNCQIEDPSFNSQTKDKLTSPVVTFGSKYEPSNKFIISITKNKLLNDILLSSRLQVELKALKKTDGRKTKRVTVEKLDDSIHAGGKHSDKCTLILVEGDSAKQFPTNGLRARSDSEYFGLFPLKGKVLNVRSATLQQIGKNKEIEQLKHILGLRIDKNLTLNDLRYGRILILTDEDNDGQHIKGLIMNLLEKYLPGVLQTNDTFVSIIKTPLIKAFKKGKKEKPLLFETEQEFVKWKNSTSNSHTYKFKYYKGLATPNEFEAQEVFRELENRVIYLNWEKSQIQTKEKTQEEIAREQLTIECKDPLFKYRDVESNSYKSFELAFNNEKADDRKSWIERYEKGKIIDSSVRNLPYSTFFNSGFIHYSVGSVRRMLPNIMDGLKPSQRKILFAAFKRLQKDEMKVEQFSAYTSQVSAYHHGQTSLEKAIVCMAKNYVGTNNINLLKPNGGFGSRKTNKAGSARYIFTQLHSIVQFLFKKEDECILNYLEEEGQSIEPDYYLPILPTILINGATGIGTGYSTKIPKYNPEDVLENIRLMLDGKQPKTMTPWYRYFNGQIVRKSQQSKVVQKESLAFNSQSTQSTQSTQPTQSTQSTQNSNLQEQQSVNSSNINIANIPVEKNTKKNLEFICRGKYDIISKTTLRITELPVSVSSIDAYLDFLKTKIALDWKEGDIVEEGKYLIEYISKCSSNTIDITLVFIPGVLQKLASEGVVAKIFSLCSLIKTTNMYLFNKDCAITKFDTTGKILAHFFNTRLEGYRRRREYYMKILKNNLDLVEWKIKFIEYYLDGKIKFKNLKVAIKQQDQIKTLEKHGFPRLAASITDSAHTQSYDYLFNMKISTLSQEKIDELKKEYEKTLLIYENYKKKNAKQLWKDELDEFEREYKKWATKEHDRWTKAQLSGESIKKKKK